MNELIFLHASATAVCDARVDKHFVGYSTLQFMEQGALELWYGDEVRELVCQEDACWFWTAYPGPRIRFHAARAAHFWNHRYAAFSGPLLQHWQRSGLWFEGAQLSPEPAKMAHEFDRLLGLIAQAGPWGPRRAVHCLEGILLELAQARDSAAQDDAWLQKARESLEHCHEFQPDYARLARQLGMGTSTFRRKFKAATGCSPHDYVLAMRLQRARARLGETNLPLKAIAAELGYRDVNYFSTQFKHGTGVSPALYRRSRQR